MLQAFSALIRSNHFYHNMSEAYYYIAVVFFPHHQTFISHLQMSYERANETVVFSNREPGGKEEQWDRLESLEKRWALGWHMGQSPAQMKTHYGQALFSSHQHTPGCLITNGWMHRLGYNWLLLFNCRWRAICSTAEPLSSRGIL